MLDFGKRKIHEYGSSYLITIPKAWARDNNLKKGSKVMVSLSKEGKLIVSPEEGSE